MIEALVILGLATWRMSHLLAKESGPFDIFKGIREFSGIVHDEDGEIVIVPEKFFPQMISCVWCNSIYIATFWMVAYYFLGTIALFLAFPFALGAVAIVIEENI